jgi:8-oxo-dGTP diphosphatase
MKHYVAGFMKDFSSNVALVRKNKPKWQAGRLNGIGGGILDGETPLAAMRREWWEETGIPHTNWTHFAEIRFPETIVHFFKDIVWTLPVFPAVNDIGEAIEIWPVDIVAAMSDFSVIPNLKWLLPMAFSDPDAKFALLTPVAANDNVTLPIGVKVAA